MGGDKEKEGLVCDGIAAIPPNEGLVRDGIATIPPKAPHPYLHPTSVLIPRHPVYLIHNDSMTSSSALPRPLVGEGSDGRVAKLGGHYLREPSFAASVTRVQLSVIITSLLRAVGEGGGS